MRNSTLNLKFNGQAACLVVLLFLFLWHPVLAQQFKKTPPEQAGFSQERLQKLTEMLHSYTDDHKVAGTVALVARNGKIVYHEAAGYRDVKAKVPLQKDDIYRIASQTKSVTCAAVMMLYEEGKFLLDDPVSEYLPEFRNPEVLKSFNEEDSSYTTEPASREVTIHDLLTHTSGISYPVIGLKEARAIYAKAGISMGFEPRLVKLADKMKILGSLPLMHQPGEAYTYGLSIDVLGYLIEVISGKSFNDFLNERLFNPLGMKDTYFYVPADKQSRMAKVYTRIEGEIAENTSNDSLGINTIYPFTKNGTYYSGGAGLSSTAYDYAIFLQMLLNGGEYNGKRFLSPYTIRLMTINQIGDIPVWGSNRIGFGFEVITEQSSTLLPWNEGMYAFGGFWGSNFWVDPEADIVALIWSQDSNAHWIDMQNKFKVMVYAALEESGRRGD